MVKNIAMRFFCSLRLPALFAGMMISASCAIQPPHAADVPSAIRVTDPRCELAIDPVGVDVSNPRLFWKVASDERGQMQTGYQLLVASSSDLLAQDHGDLWDSGKIESDQTDYVRYSGTALASSQDVFWKVRAWDKNGQPSQWSEPAKWTMGLLSPSDWKGVWISGAMPAESMLMRRKFTVGPGLKRAIVNVSGLGQYELTLNGSKAGEDLLTPGWSDYKKTILYDTRDVTSLLRAGPNAVGLRLANGIYNVERVPGRFAKFDGSHGSLRALLNLRLDYANGTTELVNTDSSWRTHTGPITFGNIYGGEDYDARLVPPNWNEPGFNDHEWAQAVEFGKADNSLRGISAMAEAVRAIETREPVKVQTFSDGTSVYDFGQNASFMPRLTLSGPVGSTVRLTPSEIVSPDGTIFRGTMGGQSRGSSWWQYTKATDQNETWFPQCYYIGSRYVKAELFPPGGASTEPSKTVDPSMLPHIVSLQDVIVHSVAAPVGTFATSNDLLNRIRTLVRWSIESNLVSLITDCPHRERLGWLEQQHLAGPTLRYEFDVSRLFAKSEHDMEDAQDASGLVPNIAPEYTKFKGTFRAAAEWGASYILVPWQQYQFDGDTDLLRDHYDGMKHYFAYLEAQAKDDVLSEGLGDWFDLGPNKPNRAQLTLPPVTASAFYFLDAQTLSQIAVVLGKEDEAKDYAAQAARIRASYNRNFFHSDTGMYATGSQGANALPLVMGIVEPSDRARVLDALVQDVEKHGDAMTTGDVCYRYLLQALAQGGKSDVIYRMVNQDTKPGYGYILKRGETSMTESWDANRTTSHDHFMLGHIIEWFYRDLAGIDLDPSGPGFKKIVICPTPVGDLSWTEASYDSIHGPISVRWDRAGQHFTLNFTIPANTTGTIYLPAKEDSGVTEGSVAADHSPGVTFLRREGDRAVYGVESGSYAFQSSW